MTTYIIAAGTEDYKKALLANSLIEAHTVRILTPADIRAVPHGAVVHETSDAYYGPNYPALRAEAVARMLTIKSITTACRV